MEDKIAKLNHAMNCRIRDIPINCAMMSEIDLNVSKQEQQSGVTPFCLSV